MALRVLCTEGSGKITRALGAVRAAGQIVASSAPTEAVSASLGLARRVIQAPRSMAASYHTQVQSCLGPPSTQCAAVIDSMPKQPTLADFDPPGSDAGLVSRVALPKSFSTAQFYCFRPQTVEETDKEFMEAITSKGAMKWREFKDSTLEKWQRRIEVCNDPMAHDNLMRAGIPNTHAGLCLAIMRGQKIDPRSLHL